MQWQKAEENCHVKLHKKHNMYLMKLVLQLKGFPRTGLKVITWSLLAAYDVRNVKREREVERRMLSKHTLFLSPTGPVNFIQWGKPFPTMGGNGLTL